MQYIRSISSLHKFKILIKKILTKILNKRNVVKKILTFQQILSFKEKDNILNYPEHYNWCKTVAENDLLIYRDNNVLKGAFLLENNQFSIKYSNKPRFESGGIFKDKTLKIYSVQNAAVLGNYGVVLDNTTNALIQETIKHFFVSEKYNEFLFSKIPSTKKQLAIAALLAEPGSDGGFYHFLFESLSKKYFWEDVEESISFFLLPGPPYPWKLKWLSFFGINSNKVIWLKSDDKINVNQLLFSSNLFNHYKPNQILRNYFRKRQKLYELSFQTNEDCVYEAIWLTRNEQESRNITWEKQLLNSLPFLKIVDFSKLSLEETLKICRNTKIVAGPHGAAFSHIIFCNENINVIEFFPDNQFQPVFKRLADICSMHYEAHIVDFNLVKKYTLQKIIDKIYTVYVNFNNKD